MKAGNAVEPGPAAEPAAAIAPRLKPELVEGAKPYGPAPGVMVPRKPSRPAWGASQSVSSCMPQGNIITVGAGLFQPLWAGQVLHHQ